MRIDITENGKSVFSLPLPEKLVVNGFFASLVPVFANQKLKKHGINLKGKFLRKFVKEFYKTKNNFGKDFEFITVESKNGEKIKIIL
jgi:hypothetical protein